MGLVLSVLFSYVGAVEFVFIVRDILHQIELHQRRLEESTNEDLDDGLQHMQDTLRKSISVARRCESEQYQCMQDGVLYENGYRVDTITEDWIEVRRAIERGQAETAVAHAVDEGRRSVESNVSASSNSAEHSSNSNSNASTNTVIEKDGVQSNKTADNGQTKGDNENDRSRSSSPDAADIHFDAYSENYLRSLDGIKLRPLVRDDGSRRRRAMKRGQSNSSNSSASAVSLSREEELKMFTSLEEEEFETIRNSDYKPLQYSSEPNLKASQHSRRHKRSPVQDLSRRSSDVIDDEVNDPWGEVVPEPYHETELWKKERNMSIAEAEDDTTNGIQQSAAAAAHNQITKLRNGDIGTDFDRCYSPVGKKYTKTSSFEDASGADHTRALNILRAQTSKDDVSFAFHLFDDIGLECQHGLILFVSIIMIIITH